VSRRTAARRAARESGAVLVLVALLLPVLIGIGGLAIDVGYWFAHKRHLQVQADAGVLAAALQYKVPCTATPVIRAATDYSSVENDQGAGYTPATINGQPGYNPQIGSTPPARLHAKLNAPTYYPDRATPNDDTVAAGDPCAAKMVDLKLTETDLPWFLKAATVNFIDAHARVELRKQLVGKKLIPIGLPDVNPKKARAFFIDKSKPSTDPNYVIASTDLVRTGVSGGQAIWSNTTSAPLTPIPVSVNISSDKIGVRVALSDTDQSLSGSFTTVCALSAVSCYDTGAGASGLTNIRGWTAPSSPTSTAPGPRDVELLQGTCAGAYFNVLANDTTCNIGVRATIDYGAGTFGSGGTPPANEKVWAFRTDDPTTLYQMTFDAAGPPAGTWSVSNAIPLVGDKTGPPAKDGDAGAVGIGLMWGVGCTNAGKSCSSSGTFNDVQSSFVGNALLSGPIKRVNVTEGVSGATDKNSFVRGSAHDLVVTLGLGGNIKVAADASDPKVTLKFNKGGLTGLVDCDSTLSVPDEFWLGCGPSYTPNTGHNCPFASTPLECVPVEPGNKVGQIAPGLNHRILGSENPGSCTNKNHWSEFFTPAGLPPGDPRVIAVFLTPLGAFNGSGNASVPILDFATFYVTGWQGVGSEKNPCQALAAADPLRDDIAGDSSEIVGHFISYIDHAPSGPPSDVPCDFASLTPCVTVFTR
jgi:hypothetical protein